VLFKQQWMKLFGARKTARGGGVAIERELKNLVLFLLNPQPKKSYNIQALGASAQCSKTAKIDMW
jgi:hypothetical protein